MAVRKVTKAPKPKGSPARKAYTKSKSRSNVKRGPSAGGPGSLSDIIVRTINGLKVPINQSSNRKKKK